MLKVEKDYEELLRLFNRHKVRYCVVGAYALAFHAIPRYTKDLDVFVEADKNNAEKILSALNEFGFSSLKLKAEDFSKLGTMIQLGYEPVRVDIVTEMDGCDFKGVWKRRVFGCYGKERVLFIGLEDLIKNKRASGRKQDMADLEILKVTLKKKKQRSKKQKQE